MKRVCGRSPPMTPNTGLLQICYQTAFTVLEFLIENNITPSNVDARLWNDTTLFERLLVATRLHAAYAAETDEHGTESLFARAVVELVISRLRWATKQRGPHGERLLWEGQGGCWQWEAAARGNYAVAFRWFRRGV
ncbi:hypothetical protein VMCG_10727 [Cytospora schulzeri]|uniref:Uncharacterized protein n=1 Tax=Cytospora schulzeri TaxID=448051 RepID=A0A423V919_9PEZI|nr:hypothetical protein VMCG_10727 [Valsa malicola]